MYRQVIAEALAKWGEQINNIVLLLTFSVTHLSKIGWCLSKLQRAKCATFFLRNSVLPLPFHLFIPKRLSRGSGEATRACGFLATVAPTDGIRCCGWLASVRCRSPLDVYRISTPARLFSVHDARCMGRCGTAIRDAPQCPGITKLPKTFPRRNFRGKTRPHGKQLLSIGCVAQW